MRVSIVTPDFIGKSCAMEGSWIYADGDLEVLHRLRNALNKSSPLVAAEVFQRTALDLQGSFVGWVDECMSTVPHNYWLATPLSKNPFDSDLFLHLVWMVLVDRAIKQGTSEIIVVTKSRGLTLALGKLCRIRGWECKRYGQINSLFQHWRRNFIAFAKWFGKLLLLGFTVIVAKRIFTDKFVKTRLANAELLLETYIHDGDVSDDGSCNDRYFPGLMAYYRSQGIQAGYFPLLYHIPFHRLQETFAAMQRSKIPFVPFEAFITFRDIAQASWMSMRYGLSFHLQTPLFYQEVPVSALVRAECFTAGLRGVIPFALACAPRRMAEAGIRPKWFVDWFENQNIDKGVVLGLKEGLPNCHVIAVRQYAYLTNFLSQLSTSGEVKAGVVPTENWVCGEALKSIISRFDTAGKYFAVPALRYSYLHQFHASVELGKVLLVLLTHSVEESMGILDCVAPLCMDGGAEISHIVVKTHPDMNLGLFRQKAEKRFPALGGGDVEWTNRKLGELLPTAKVVVTSGSSTAVEAICGGIPVVLVGRQAGLNFNPLEGVDSRMWSIVYTSSDLRMAIVQRSCEERLPGAERIAIAEITRKGFFMETGSDEMRRFLPTIR